MSANKADKIFKKEKVISRLIKKTPNFYWWLIKDIKAAVCGLKVKAGGELKGREARPGFSSRVLQGG
ncbi:hypothetical protein C4J81_12305 [Deltaproteobacteria bacterium Smac51]|nr:hypothetical protein C4J81_12305 [Deltaproteobacteria bacterium Smac51]